VTHRVAPWLQNSRWPTVQIRRVARLGTGHTPGRKVDAYWEDCTVPWITLADVWQLRRGTQDVILDTKEKISRLGLANSAAVLHPRETVILSRTASVGFSAIMGADMATSQDFATWTCGPLLHHRFLLHALRAMAPDLKRVASGSTHKTIYMPDIEELQIPLPPLEEQVRIAQFLDTEVARLNQLAAMRDMQALALDELSMASISEAVAAPQDVPMVRLGYLAKIQSGITVDAGRDVSGDVVTKPYLRVANVQAGYLDLESVTEIVVPTRLASSSTLKAGDVLMTEGGDLDKLGRGTVWNDEIPGCLHQNHVFAVRPDQARIDGDYLALLTRSAYGRAYFESTGTKTTNLASTSSGRIRDFQIPLLAISDQRRVVEGALAALKELDRLAVELKYQQERLTEIRQSVITAAVTGQLDVAAAREGNVE
jgi:type I restriction enzyme, S subunit